MQIFVERLARYMALLGGIVLTLLIILTCVSVLGRGLNTFGHSDFLTSLSAAFADTLISSGVGPINGDFEIVEAGIAFAIFAFLPYTQLHGGHATVDIFTSMMPRVANNFVTAFWEVVLSAVILLITWRHGAGFIGKLDNGETTFLLEFPIWWAYGASLIAAIVASIVALYTAFTAIYGVVTGHPPRPKEEGAGH
ncbi:MAG: TRAP transporter small permease [Magnetospiraceae bacterium]